MASNDNDNSFDDSQSSLGDSAYDIIDDASLVTSDDEDRSISRQSTPSSDGNANGDDRDDLESIDASNDGERVESCTSHPSFQNLEHSDISYTPDLHAPASDQSHEYEPTNATRNRTFSQSQHTERDSSSAIKFDETKAKDFPGPPMREFEYIDVVHPLGTSGKLKSHNAVLYHRAPPTWSEPIALAVQQSMVENSLLLDAPYRILFVGDGSAKELIIQKLGAALAATPDSPVQPSRRSNSSKFSIVPISSFANESSPDVVLIDSTGLEMIVEQCTNASCSKGKGGQELISMSLDNDKTVESRQQGNDYIISQNWEIPDLAIFYQSREENSGVNQTWPIAQLFVHRHDIPYIHISSTPLWDQSNRRFLFYPGAPRLCLNPTDLHELNTPQPRQIPIDLPTFTAIETTQMNRNLAYLAAFRKSLESGRDGMAVGDKLSILNGRQWNIGFEPVLTSIKNHPIIRFSEKYTTALRSPRTRTALATATILSFLMLYVLATLSLQNVKDSYLVSKATNGLTTSFASDILKPSVTESSVSLPSTTQSIASLKSTASAQETLASSISVVQTEKDVASFLLGPNSLARNKSDKFNVHVIGDCHIVLRPPHWLNSLRRSPILMFNVTRQGIVLPHQVSSLFDGVYAVKLLREDAYGALNISVWTKGKPRIDETFQVEFGTPWLNSLGWKKAAQKLTKSIQEKLENALALYGYDGKEHQHSARQNTVQKTIRTIRSTCLNRTSKAIDLVIAQTKELSHGFLNRFGRERVRLSRQLSERRHSLGYSLLLQTRQIHSEVLRQAHALSKAATPTRLWSLSRELSNVRMRYVKETQKKALRMWWTIYRVPAKKAESSPDSRKNRVTPKSNAAHFI
ncbi:hypothetical protein MMC20_003295 [Loxospora ochrophaea]|nr:hypothetical protein [Loxospora ochrophaea]